MARALKIHRKGVKFTRVLHPGGGEGRDSHITEKDGGGARRTFYWRKEWFRCLLGWSTAGALAVPFRVLNPKKMTGDNVLF